MRGLLSLAMVFAGTLLVMPDLTPATLKAYERYVALTETRLQSERAGTSPLFWIDRQPERAKAAAWLKLRAGGVVVESLETRDGSTPIAVPGGRVHHWVATVLLPGVTVDRVLALIRDYDSYPKVFAPLMTRARAVERHETRDVVALRTSVQKIISVVMDGDYVMEYTRLGPARVATSTIATNLHQVLDEGLPGERREPTEKTAGYLWRYRMYCAMEQRPEGVLDQCESLTLTRRVPGLVSWLVGGTVAAIPRDSLTLMLSGTRKRLVK
jgi:hypothetical protein